MFKTEQAQNLAKLNPRLEAALKERAALSDSTESPKTVSEKETESSKPAAPVNVGLKGVSQSLIDKVTGIFANMNYLHPLTTALFIRYELEKLQKHKNK